MSINKVTSIYFSPTQSTRKIVQTIASKISDKATELLDLTLPAADKEEVAEINTDLAIIGVPVYGGRVPLTAVNRLKKIKVDNVPAVIVVVYGNRHYDDALLELHELAVNCGFKPIAGGAFIAEHSFSLEQYPIAKSRPDMFDLGEAESFAESLVKRYATGAVPRQLTSEDLPGNYPYIARKPSPSFAPETDKEKCGNCRKCVVICPTGAISKRDNSITNIDMCILCGACIKVCENDARSMNHPAFLATAKRISTNFNTRRVPELFLGEM